MTAIANSPAIDRQAIAEELQEARNRTLQLLAPLSDEDLRSQHDPLMSPILWDLGHIAHFEELWLTRNLDGPIEFVEMPGLYNPFEHPRSARGALALPGLDEVRAIMDEIRGRVLARLVSADFDGSHPLLRDGFVYQMVLQHEYQHNETMLQTLQLKRGEGYKPESRVELPTGRAPEREMIYIPEGKFVMGTDDHARALDNERNAHVVDLSGFLIDATPVTNGAYLRFVEEGGYERSELWSPAGWEYIREERISAPKHWYQPEPHSWWTERFGFDEPLASAAPVVHVSWYEAEAYARWAGKRLPTEAEWEKAASWNPDTHTKRLYPWGDEAPTPQKANLDQLAFRAADVGAYPEGASAYGVLGMSGDVWEWTATDLYAYPGFEAFPYKEYSEIFFGPDYKVLRGGSWATRPPAVRNTFRNWDFPIRRQLFCGFRCAKDS